MKIRNLMLLLIASSILLPAWAKKPEVQVFSLENGMKILVKEDHRAPVVTHMIWYKAGGIDEVNGKTGIAHLLEHLMFKGTPKNPDGAFSRKIAAMGGSENAFTGKDYTAYYQTVGRDNLANVMALEADRMANLALTEDAFAPELRVVMEERRWRTDDRPFGLMREALYATAFIAHPYRRPIVGWMSDLETMTLADAQAWYASWYAPNNATMVVVGDVNAHVVYAMAKRYFGKIPKKIIVKTRAQTEPEQRGMKRVFVKAPAKNPYVTLAFKAPTLRDIENDDDIYALDMLSAILDGYDNARLNATLVRTEKVAYNVTCSYDGMARGPVLFYLGGTPAKGVTTQALEKHLRDEVARIVKDGVSDVELARVKRQLIASQVYKRDSVFGQAMEIGVVSQLGFSYQSTDRMLEKLKAVTSAKVQAVARKYFNDETLTVVTLLPQAVASAARAQ